MLVLVISSGMEKLNYFSRVKPPAWLFEFFKRQLAFQIVKNCWLQRDTGQIGDIALEHLVPLTEVSPEPSWSSARIKCLALPVGLGSNGEVLHLEWLVD